jgi:hypothetical protein
MSAWSLLAIPLCLGGIVLLLAGMSWFEQRLLSPRSLIVYTAKSRHAGPDTVEMLVTAQSEELLRGRGLARMTTTAVAAATEAIATATEVVPSAAASEKVAPAGAAQAAPVATRP